VVQMSKVGSLDLPELKLLALSPISTIAARLTLVMRVRFFRPATAKPLFPFTSLLLSYATYIRSRLTTRSYDHCSRLSHEDFH
jgi:hypothetical protein